MAVLLFFIERQMLHLAIHACRLPAPIQDPEIVLRFPRLFYLDIVGE